MSRISLVTMVVTGGLLAGIAVNLVRAFDRAFGRSVPLESADRGMAIVAERPPSETARASLLKFQRGDTCRLKCRDGIGTYRWLSGNAADRTVGLVDKPDASPGTRWEVMRDGRTVHHFSPRSDAHRAWWLAADAPLATLRLVHESQPMRGVCWQVVVVKNSLIHLKCLRDPDGCGWLAGDSETGGIQLVKQQPDVPLPLWEAFIEGQAGRGTE